MNIKAEIDEAEKKKQKCFPEWSTESLNTDQASGQKCVARFLSNSRKIPRYLILPLATDIHCQLATCWIRKRMGSVDIYQICFSALPEYQDNDERRNSLTIKEPKHLSQRYFTNARPSPHSIINRLVL